MAGGAGDRNCHLVIAAPGAVSRTAASGWDPIPSAALMLSAGVTALDLLVVLLVLAVVWRCEPGAHTVLPLYVFASLLCVWHPPSAPRPDGCPKAHRSQAIQRRVRWRGILLAADLTSVGRCTGVCSGAAASGWDPIPSAACDRALRGHCHPPHPRRSRSCSPGPRSNQRGGHGERSAVK